MTTYWHCLPTADVERSAHVRVPARTLRGFATRILEAAGLAAPDAGATAECLVLADLRGRGGHGVFRLLQYTDSIATGEINRRPRVRVIKKRGAVGVVDADGGYGYRPSLTAMSLAVTLAGRYGIGSVGVRNSHHFGMAATFALKAAQARAIGIALTNSLPQIAPPGASRAVVGNNPYAFAVPRSGRRRPIVVDIALTEAAFGAAALAGLAGTRLPLGHALDTSGHPTTDPGEAMRSGILVAVGRQKGYALSVAAEVLSAALTGSPIALDSHCHRLVGGGVGHLMLAIQPDFFIERRAFDAAVETMCAHITSTPPADPDGAVQLPGENGWRTYDRRMREGVPLPPALHEELRRLALRLGVRPLAPRQSVSL
jgi:LDH2 family malate/lactate/ureidoglycolate dehydrogenase